MSDITIAYKGATIAELSASGSKTLNTSGKYCEGDISITYDKPEATSVVLVQDANGYIILPPEGSATTYYIANGVSF